MEKEKVRSLDKMPPSLKLNYCKILALVLNLGESINQLKMAEFYRLMANIRLASETRKSLLMSLEVDQDNLTNLCEAIFQGVNQQERNIIRFSLIKDAIIIMNSDFVMDAEENKLLRDLIEKLDVTEEQLQFLMEEYQRDQHFQENVDQALYEKMIQETIAKALGLGIPLSILYFSGVFQGFGPLGIVFGLRKIGVKKYSKNYSLLTGIVSTIVVSYGAYHTIKWLLGWSTRKEKKYKELVHSQMKEIHSRAIQYAKKDFEYIGGVITEDHENEIKGSLISIHGLLEKTYGTLLNTKPKLI